VRLAVAVHPIAVHRMKPVIDRIFSFDQANRRLPIWRAVRISEKWRSRSADRDIWPSIADSSDWFPLQDFAEF
jgi:hypothetical protein